MMCQLTFAQARFQLTVKGPVVHHKQARQMENFVALDQPAVVAGINPAQPFNGQLHAGQHAPGHPARRTARTGKDDQRGAGKCQQ